MTRRLVLQIGPRNSLRRWTPHPTRASFAAVSADGIALLFDDEGRFTFRSRGLAVIDVAFSPDGGRMALLGRRRVVVMDDDGGVLWQAPVDEARAVAFSAKGVHVATWAKLRSFAPHGKEGRPVAITPGIDFLEASMDGTRLFGWNDERLEIRNRGRRSAIDAEGSFFDLSVRASDGACAGRDGSDPGALWVIDGNDEQHDLDAIEDLGLPGSYAEEVRLHPTRPVIAVRSSGHELTIYDWVAERVLARADGVHLLGTFSFDGSMLVGMAAGARSESGAAVWRLDLDQGRVSAPIVRKPLDLAPSAIAFEPEGRALAVGFNDGRAVAWSREGIVTAGRGFARGLQDVHLASDGTILTGGAGPSAVERDASGTKRSFKSGGGAAPMVDRDASGATLAGRRLWEADATGKKPPPVRFPLLARFARGGASVVAKDHEAPNELTVLSREGEALGRIARGATEIRAFALSRHGDRVIVGREGGGIEVCDLAGDSLFRESARPPDAHAGPVVASVALSPSGRLAAASDFDGDVRVWDIDASTIVGSWTGLLRRWSSHAGLAFAPSEEVLAVLGEESVKLIRLATGEIAELVGAAQRRCAWIVGNAADGPGAAELLACCDKAWGASPEPVQPEPVDLGAFFSAV